MSFLSGLLGKTRGEAVALIDVGAASVAGAIVLFVDAEPPTIIHERRLPIEIQEGEAHERAMLRALDVLGAALVREGIPALQRAGSGGRLSSTLLAIDAPWLATDVHHEYIGDPKGFTFTKRLVDATVAKVATVAADKVLTDTSVLHITLNGYETADPYGKRVNNATILILTSIMAKELERQVLLTIGNQLRTKTAIIAGSSMRYQAMRVAFPHESDLIIADVTGPEAVVALVRRGVLTGVAETVSITALSKADDAIHKITELAKTCPLPRTIFILARDAEYDDVKKALETMDVARMCFSNSIPKVVPVLASHLAPRVRQLTTAPPDLPIFLMALYRAQSELD